MSIHQEHFGRKFYKDKRTGYWISVDYSPSNPRIRAHQWVWICNHGKIPKGYHIHHKNDDKSDNRIENLEIIEKSRHLSYHMSCPERKKRSAEIANNIRHLTKAWHSSEEGRAWHKLHAIKGKFGKWAPTKRICLVCNIEYETSKRSAAKFCSNKCKSRYRRALGIDNEEKDCGYCGKRFFRNKYAKGGFCSKSCSKKHFWSLKCSH